MKRKLFITISMLVLITLIVIFVFQYKHSKPQVEADQSKGLYCVSDSDCIPCGEECISWKENSVIDCISKFGLKCACIKNACQKNNTCSTNSNCEYLNTKYQKPVIYGLCLNGVCVQSCSSNEYKFPCK